jgi:hypothetical protein
MEAEAESNQGVEPVEPMRSAEAAGSDGPAFAPSGQPPLTLDSIPVRSRPESFTRFNRPVPPRASSENFTLLRSRREFWPQFGRDFPYMS